MYTSVAWLALAGFFNGPVAAPVETPEPVWLTNYAEAQQLARSQNRPLAVFVAPGSDSHERVVNEGTLTMKTRKVLQDSYVCVHLDAFGSESRSTVQALAVKKGRGVILSDRSGDYQAFHCDGMLPEHVLLAKLKQFSESDSLVKTTDVHHQPTARTSFYPPANPRPAPINFAPRANC